MLHNNIADINGQIRIHLAMVKIDNSNWQHLSITSLIVLNNIRLIKNNCQLPLLSMDICVEWLPHLVIVNDNNQHSQHQCRWVALFCCSHFNGSQKKQLNDISRLFTPLSSFQKVALLDRPAFSGISSPFHPGNQAHETRKVPPSRGLLILSSQFGHWTAGLSHESWEVMGVSPPKCEMVSEWSVPRHNHQR